MKPNIAKDIVNNLEKITGYEPKELIVENYPVEIMFDEVMIDKTFPSIRSYALKKYDVDLEYSYGLLEEIDNLIMERVLREF